MSRERFKLRNENATLIEVVERPPETGIKRNEEGSKDIAAVESLQSLVPVDLLQNEPDNSMWPRVTQRVGHLDAVEVADGPRVELGREVGRRRRRCARGAFLAVQHHVLRDHVDRY